MTVDEPAAPVRRFAAGPLVAEVNECTGSALRLVGMAGHGEQGVAAYVDWPDGRRGVLTRTATAITELRRTVEVLELARAHGLPVPRHHLIVPLRDNTAAVVQERLPGAPVRHADAGVIDALVAMNDRFAGLLADRRDVEVPPLYLRRSGPAYWRHESLARYDDRTRQLLDQIRGIGAAGPHEMLGDDLVHRDYTLGNILFNHAGRVTGVVDWNEGVARGDRRFALAGLLFDLSFSILLDDDQHGIEQSAIDRLTEILRESTEPSLLRAYWAHFTLKGLDLTISHFPPDTVDVLIHVGQSRLT